MRNDKNKKTTRNLLYVILLSAFFHLVFLHVPIKDFFAVKAPPQKKIELALQPIDLNNIDPALLSKNKVKLPNAARPNQQIVNSDQTKKTDEPVNSRFLGAQNQKFDKQQMAKRNGIFKEAGEGTDKGADERIVNKENSATPKGDEGMGKKSPQRAKTPAPKTGPGSLRVPGLSDLAMGEVSETVKGIKSSKEKASALGIKNGNSQATGFAQNNDFIEDVALGEATQLNTVEFKYFGFYHRIRQKLEQHWGNTLRQKAEYIHKSGRKLANNENHVTELTITLDEKGNIKSVIVKSSSGVQELDTAAIESFNKAGPFPNPPKGMMVNGEAVLSWGFVVRS